MAARFARALGEDTGEHQVPVVDWEEVKSLVPRGVPTPSPGSADTGAVTSVDTPSPGAASTSAVTEKGPRQHPSKETDLDVPGLEDAFEQEAPPDPTGRQTTNSSMASEMVEPAPASRRWLVLGGLCLLAAGALAHALWSSPDRVAAAQDAGGPAPADALARDRQPATAPDSGLDQRPPADRGAGDTRVRPPNERKVPKKPPRRPPKKPKECPESRVGESTMNPFGTKCRPRKK